MVYGIWESETYQADYWQGVLVITDKVTGKCGSISLRDNNGRNITKRQWDSSIKTHGVEFALSTWAKLITRWEG